ncbi:MAG: D-lyxose/D-mannose family sugar isomerase [Anaerolineaceae bacterium]|nr:D-lyxose/D-mannose family sugar isomerase [Anaerolineaceae bacterium]
MKRSAINQLMREATGFIQKRGFYLPPFAFWTPEIWRTKGEEVREIVDRQLGWDITDFGLGNFQKYGLLLFTIRNGDPQNLKGMTGKIYCEKLLIVGEGQITPFHFHRLKTEDIINRGGGKLAMQLYNSSKEEKLADTDVAISIDGDRRVLSAGSIIQLEPGESVTYPSFLYHQFWGVGGTILVGEVSVVNDDHNDNRFYQNVGRFPHVEEDEPVLYPLVNDYSRFYKYG